MVFTLSLVTPPALLPTGKPSVAMGIGYSSPAATQRTISRQKWTWQRSNDTNLTLTVPVTPLPTKEQVKTTAARLASDNPWNADNL